MEILELQQKYKYGKVGLYITQHIDELHLREAARRLPPKILDILALAWEFNTRILARCQSPLWPDPASWPWSLTLSAVSRPRYNGPGQQEATGKSLQEMNKMTAK